MLRAHTKGFKFECNSSDENYVVREHLYLSAIRDRYEMKLMETRFGLKAASLLTSAVRDSDVSNTNEKLQQLVEIYEDFGRLLCPWYKWNKKLESMSDKETTELIGAWEDAFGKLDSPEVQQEIENMKTYKPPVATKELGTPI